APHAFADLVHVRHVLARRVVAFDWSRVAWGRVLHYRGGARQPLSTDIAAGELVAETLDLLFLAIHVPDVVAQVEVQVPVALARQLLFDGLELEEQVVTESAHQAEA